MLHVHAHVVSVSQCVWVGELVTVMAASQVARLLRSQAACLLGRGPNLVRKRGGWSPSAMVLGLTKPV